jgi:hypothetical protein
MREGKTARAAYAKQQLAALRLRLSRITLRVATPDVEGLTIQLTNLTSVRELPRSAWSSEVVVDPGTVVLVITAPGHKTARVERAIVAGAALAIDVPALDPEGTAIVPPIERPTEPQRSRTPLIIGAGGTVIVAGGLVIGLVAKLDYDKAINLAENRSAQRLADVSTVVTAAGIVAVGVAIVLHLRRPSDRVVLSPTTNRDGAGLAVVGWF